MRPFPALCIQFDFSLPKWASKNHVYRLISCGNFNIRLFVGKQQIMRVPSEGTRAVLLTNIINLF